MTTPLGIVTCLPEADVDDLVGVVEVLVEEQLPTVAAPVTLVGELRAVFGERATIGAWEVADVDQLDKAIIAEAAFVLADSFDEQMAVLTDARSTTLFAAAMTPLEVRAVIDLGAAGAMLWPADVVGHVMAQHLKRIGLAERVIPMGGVGAYAAGEWIKQGCPAACVGSTLLGDAPTGGDLGLLRDRCGSFRKAHERAVTKLQERALDAVAEATEAETGD